MNNKIAGIRGRSAYDEYSAEALQGNSGRDEFATLKRTINETWKSLTSEEKQTFKERSNTRKPDIVRVLKVLKQCLKVPIFLFTHV